MSSWTGGIDKEMQIKKVASSKTVLTDASPLQGEAGSLGEVEVLFEQRIPGDYSIGVKTKSSTDNLLIFNWQNILKYEVLIDGSAVEKKFADGVWITALVPRGEHEVVLRRSRNPLSFMMAFFSIVLAGVFGIRIFFSSKQKYK